MKLAKKLALSALLSISPVAALAQSTTFSHFGTIQYTQSTDPFNYQRFVNDQGTLKQNSVLGFQVDSKLNSQLSASVQLVVAPRNTSDEGVSTFARWAYVNYAFDDYDIRIGRQRLGFYLDSRNLEVQETFTVANPAPELYFSASVSKFDGLTLSRNFNLSDWDSLVRFSVLAGKTSIPQRQFDGQRVLFNTLDADVLGAVLRLETSDLSAQLSYHELKATNQADTSLMGIPVSVQSTADARFVALGLRKDFASHRVTAETAAALVDFSAVVTPPAPFPAIVQESKFPREKSSAMVYEYTGNEKTTPYLGHYRFLSDAEDQYSLALGLRHRLDSNRSLKAEILQVNSKRRRIQLYDGPFDDRTFNVFSLSYNWAY